MKRLMIFIIGLSFVYVFTGIAYADSAKIQNPDNGHWYQRIDTIIRWHDAKAHCETLGGHLVTISSAQENSFVNALYNARTVGGGWNWLGATDERIEGLWEWVTGEDWGYTNWAPGEPNNLYPEHWLIMYSNGTWNDVFGSGFIGGKFYDNVGVFICEWDLIGKVVPELDYDTNDNSRTLVNGTCWKFTAEIDQNQPQPTLAKVKWNLKKPGGGQCTVSECGQFFDSTSNNWSNSTELETPFTSGTLEVDIKSGLENCEVHAEGFDDSNNSIGKFKPAKVNVVVVPGLKQNDPNWANEHLGFWKKEVIPQSTIPFVDSYIKFFPKTIGKIGCKLTSLAILSHYYNKNFSPKSLNNHLRNLGGHVYYEGDASIGPYGYKKEEESINPPYSLWCYLIPPWFHIPNIQPLDINPLDWGLPVPPGTLTIYDASSNRAFHATDTLSEHSVFEASGGSLMYDTKSTNVTDLIKNLKEKQPIPVLVQVKYNHTDLKNPHHHFVLAIGLNYKPGYPNDFMILDPSGPNGNPFPFSENNASNNKHSNRTSSYVIENVRLFEDAQGRNPNPNITGLISCNAQLLILDSYRRKAGVLPEGVFIDEIGRSHYDVEDPEGISVSYEPEYFAIDGHKSLTLYSDTFEQYEIKVIGTGPGPYFLNVLLTDSVGDVHVHSLIGGIVDEGVTWVYTLETDPASGYIDGELVPPTTNSMSSDIDAYWANGDITNQGIAKSLKAKLVAIESSISRGNIKAASNVLNAFINEVEAQREKFIVAKAANDLIFHANYINLNLE